MLPPSGWMLDLLQSREVKLSLCLSIQGDLQVWLHVQKSYGELTRLKNWSITTRIHSDLQSWLKHYLFWGFSQIVVCFVKLSCTPLCLENWCITRRLRSELLYPGNSNSYEAVMQFSIFRFSTFVRMNTVRSWAEYDSVQAGIFYFSIA